jgi:peptide/nickel transport system permease protein
MPALTLAAYLTATITRITRSGVVQALESHYVRTARAKGLTERRVLFHHALRNALIPLVTVLGLLIGQVLGGAVVTETVFAWPGVGRLIVDAVYQRDFPVVQASLLIVALLFIIVNLLVDISYQVLNPRLRDS